ncbi:MAG: response regulator [Acidobacteriota bacterium]|nr:response regulator [Acidobacteriota bacterium]
MRSDSASTTVFIVDDDPSIREAVCNLLDAEGVASRSFGSTDAFLREWEPDIPGCLLLDVRLPGMSGTAFQEELNRRGLAIPVIIMTAHGDIPMVRKVMKAGAIEFLTKPFQREELLNAIRQAFEKDQARREAEKAYESIRVCFETLSQRERKVMELVAAGLPNKQIAAELGISEITVKVHRHNVMEKMHADSLADLVRLSDKVQQRQPRK